uniref:Uncharacterized protein n=1 Tax=Anopheles atroparvus TaxID=41427 RepID=A0AAG5DU20_ANOAO
MEPRQIILNISTQFPFYNTTIALDFSYQPVCLY